MKHFCQRVLVIDGNMINPGVAEMAGLMGNLQGDSRPKAFRGFFPRAPDETESDSEQYDASWETEFGGIIDFETALVRDQERGLDFLLLGDMEWTAAVRREVPVLLNKMSEHYDFIFVDSPPILFTDTTELLVTLAHVVVLIAQGDRTKLKDFARTTDLILKLEVPAMAAVLNWGGTRPLTWFDGMMTKISFPAVRQVLQRLNDIGNKE
jgi:Mrp family chromosome partitioning ATPase